MKRADDTDIDFKYEDAERLAGGLACAIDNAVVKRCKECDKIKPVGEFYRHPQTADGLMTRCKQCHRQKVYTPKGRGWEYRIVHDPGGGWTQHSTLRRCEINDLLDRD